MQEEGNVPFVIDNGLGTFEKKPEKIAGILQGWFGDKREDFLQHAQRAKHVGDKWRGALFRIVADLAVMCEAALELAQPKGNAVASCCARS